MWNQQKPHAAGFGWLAHSSYPNVTAWWWSSTCWWVAALQSLATTDTTLGAPGFQQVWQCHPPLHLCTGTTRGEGMIPACQMFSGLPGWKLFLTPGCSMVFQPAVPHQAERDAQGPFTWDPEDTSPHPLLAAPKGVVQVWCVPAIPVSNRNISLQSGNLSLCLGPSCFPWGAQSSTGPSPSSSGKSKPSQLVQGLFPGQPHEAVWQQLSCYWSHQAWWDRPGLSKRSHLRM